VKAFVGLNRANTLITKTKEFIIIQQYRANRAKFNIFICAARPNCYFACCNL
jgi:hypothetical protein